MPLMISGVNGARQLMEQRLKQWCPKQMEENEGMVGIKDIVATAVECILSWLLLLHYFYASWLCKTWGILQLCSAVAADAI